MYPVVLALHKPISYTTTTAITVQPYASSSSVLVLPLSGGAYFGKTSVDNINALKTRIKVPSPYYPIGIAQFGNIVSTNWNDENNDASNLTSLGLSQDTYVGHGETTTDIKYSYFDYDDESYYTAIESYDNWPYRWGSIYLAIDNAYGSLTMSNTSTASITIPAGTSWTIDPTIYVYAYTNAPSPTTAEFVV